MSSYYPAYMAYQAAKYNALLAFALLALALLIGWYVMPLVERRSWGRGIYGGAVLIVYFSIMLFFWGQG